MILLDASKSGLQNVYAAINADNGKQYDETIYTLGPPSPWGGDPTGFRNTAVLGTATSNSPFEGSQEFYYHRVDLAQYEPLMTADWPDAGVDEAAMKAFLHSLGIITDDITFSTTSPTPDSTTGQAKVTVTAKSDSYAHIGTAVLTYNASTVVVSGILLDPQGTPILTPDGSVIYI